MKQSIIACLLVAAFLWPFHAVVAEQGVAASQARGAQLLAPFKRQLQGALKAGLQQGMVEAIAACQLQAPAIAASLSVDGVRVGRSSHRLRNPNNVAPDWVAPILDTYVASAAGRTPRSVALSDNRTGYIEPILLQPLCTTCHGTEIATPVAAEIRARYPDDEAVGFEVGYLRGVFWVEYADVQ
jgi:hypothetical protein